MPGGQPSNGEKPNLTGQRFYNDNGDFFWDFNRTAALRLNMCLSKWLETFNICLSKWLKFIKFKLCGNFYTYSDSPKVLKWVVFLYLQCSIFEVWEVLWAVYSGCKLGLIAVFLWDPLRRCKLVSLGSCENL